LRPPELSTLIVSQTKPRVCATSAMCVSGRCSSVRVHGVSQKPMIVGRNTDVIGDHAGWKEEARQAEMEKRPPAARSHFDATVGSDSLSQESLPSRAFWDVKGTRRAPQDDGKLARMC